MRNRTINALIRMGIPADISGFRYITDIMCLFEYREHRYSGICKIYEQIAEMNGTSTRNVERTIRHAFSFVTEGAGVREEVEKYLPTKNTSNGNLLHVLYIKLKQEEEQENAD